MAINISTTLMPKKDFRRHLTQNERTEKTARRTENKIKTCCKSSIIQSHTDALHQNLRGGSVLFPRQFRRDT